MKEEYYTKGGMTGSCDMDDLIIYPLEQVANNFKLFLDQTGQIVETLELFEKYGSHLRLKFDKWPSKEDAEILFGQCMTYAKKRSVKWSEVDKKLFYWIVIRYYIYKDITENRQLTAFEWRDISKLVLGRSAHQCRLKWEQKYKISLSEVPWTEEEDQLLQEIHNEFSKLGKENKWSQIAREIHKRSPNQIFRQPKQCRERWINKLDPNISNDPWTKAQEIELLKTILIRGKKWSELSALYGRVRTENSLKNKYNSLLKREKQKYEFETINPQLFAKVQKLRMDYAIKFGKITPIEEIDNYEWQFIVLAIQSLQVELLISQGKFLEAQKVKNDEFFQDLFLQENYLGQNNFQQPFQLQTKQEILYKKHLQIKKYEVQQNIEFDKSGIVIYNPKTKKLFITPFNTIEFHQNVLKYLYKSLKQEEHMKSSTLSASDLNNMQRSHISQDDINRKSIQQPLLFISPHPNQSYIMPIGQSMSYWPSFQGQYKQDQNLSQSLAQQPSKKAATFDDLLDDINIKVVDSDEDQ
ncbi:hypothetical protein pb186bvf_008325 [Paramecium bursaria]